MGKITKGDFTEWFSAVMEDQEERLLCAMKKARVSTNEEMNKKIDNTESTNNERDEKVAVLEEKVDEFEQRNRLKNVSITGLSSSTSMQ